MRCHHGTAAGTAERKGLMPEGGETAGNAGRLDAQHESPAPAAPG